MNQKKYSEIFEEYASALKDDIEQKLSRKLTRQEKNGLRNTGTLLMLEAFDREIYYAQNHETVENALIDCVQSFQQRYEDVQKELFNKLEQLLKREITPKEKEKLTMLQNVNEIGSILEKLNHQNKLENTDGLL